MGGRDRPRREIKKAKKSNKIISEAPLIIQPPMTVEVIKTKGKKQVEEEE